MNWGKDDASPYDSCSVQLGEISTFDMNQS